MTLPPRLDLSMMRGDSKTWTFDLTDGSSLALNLTGASLWFTAKRKHADSDGAAIFQITTGGGITTVGAAANGRIAVAVSPSNTAQLASTHHRLVYDLQVKLSGGEAQTALYGFLDINPDVTLAT